MSDGETVVLTEQSKALIRQYLFAMSVKIGVLASAFATIFGGLVALAFTSYQEASAARTQKDMTEKFADRIYGITADMSAFKEKAGFAASEAESAAAKAKEAQSVASQAAESALRFVKRSAAEVATELFERDDFKEEIARLLESAFLRKVANITSDGNETIITGKLKVTGEAVVHDLKTRSLENTNDTFEGLALNVGLLAGELKEHLIPLLASQNKESSPNFDARVTKLRKAIGSLEDFASHNKNASASAKH